MSIGSQIQHFNFAGGLDTDPANRALNSGNYAVAFDNSGNVYCCNSSNVVHKFNRNGTLLGTLGTFSLSPVEMKVLATPSNGTWLLAVNGPVNGEAIQGICISGGPGTGTVTNSLGTMYAGIFSGDNQGAWDVDASGNVWMFQ